MLSVLPLTSLRARRKWTDGFSRRSCAFAAVANGQSLPGPAQVGLAKIAVEAALKTVGRAMETAPFATLQRNGSLPVVAASVGKNSPYLRGVAGGFRSVPIVKSDSKSSAFSSVLFGQPLASVRLTKSSNPKAPVFAAAAPTDGGGLGSWRSPRRSEK